MDVFYGIILGLGLVFGLVNVVQLIKASSLAGAITSTVGIAGAVVAVVLSVLHFAG